MKRPCLRCGAFIPRGTLCPACQKRRDDERVIVEPWRGVYTTREWGRAQRACLKRDGGQCRRRLPSGERCPETQHLQAHHTTSLRDLWRQADGDWDRFVSLATRVDGLAALCPRDHAAAERAVRRAIPGR